MQKFAFVVATVGAAFVLTACSGGTPECGSTAIKADLQELAEARVVKAINQELNIPPLNSREELEAAIKERLSYDFKSIRVAGRDEATDTFKCDSTLVVAIKGTDRTWEQAFPYEVYSIEDADSDYEMAYEEGALRPLWFGASAVLQQIAMAAENKVTGPAVLQELQDVRNAGRAGTQREREILESLVQRGMEAPAVTEAQRQLALDEMQKLEYPGLVYADVPQQILDQAEARQAQALEEERIREQAEEDAKRTVCAESPQPELDPRCS